MEIRKKVCHPKKSYVTCLHGPRSWYWVGIAVWGFRYNKIEKERDKVEKQKKTPNLGYRVMAYQPFRAGFRYLRLKVYSLVTHSVGS